MSPPPGFNAEFDSNYHYVPDKTVCLIFVSFFGLATVVHAIEAVYFRMWWLFGTVVLAGIGEIIGWSARYWSSLNYGILDTPFLMQISTTIISPTFLLAVYFVMLGRIINLLGPQYSRLNHKLYTIIFCTADVVALVVQAVGGGLASSATNPTPGGHIMLGGIVFQLGILIVYISLACEFFLRFHFDRPIMKNADGSSALIADREMTKLRFLIWGMVLSVTCLFIRGIYRTIELSDGWDGRIISTQVYFDFLDGMMVCIAIWTLALLHPGYLFPSHKLNPNDIKLTTV